MARDLFRQAQQLDVLCDRRHRQLSPYPARRLARWEILADVYLLMTGGQTKLNLASETSESKTSRGYRRSSSGE